MSLLTSIQLAGNSLTSSARLACSTKTPAESVSRRAPWEYGNRRSKPRNQSVQTNATTLQNQLSHNLDVDLTQAISDLTARQTAFQAALQTTAAISKLALLNYL